MGSDNKVIISPIEEIIEDAKQGKMYVLVDAEDRENEGDLIIAGEFANAKAINFMAKYARGLICLIISSQRSKELDLDLMERTSQSRHDTAFTLSIEAKEGVTTGISAADRALTIKTAIDKNSIKGDVVTPGHVFPIIAKDGGVLVRAGHTEASLDISRLAGLNPSAVICEIMNEDGTMARLPDLLKFCAHHDIKIGTITDLISYRKKHDKILKHLTSTRINTNFAGEFDLNVYVNTIHYAEHIALVKGDISSDEPVAVRMHSINLLDDIIGVNLKRDQLVKKSLDIINNIGSGVLVLIREARARSVSERIDAINNKDKHSKKTQTKDNKLVEYGIGAEILGDLGVKKIKLISDSEIPNIVAIKGYDFEIVGKIPIND